MAEQKKNEINVHDIELEVEVPFIDEHNRDYIHVTSIKPQKVDGESKNLYFVKVDCANVHWQLQS